MRTAIVLLSLVAAVPAQARKHHRHHHIPMPKERVVNDVGDNTLCAGTANPCSGDVHNNQRTASDISDSFSSNGTAIAYAEEDISTLLRKNYDNLGWWNRGDSTVMEPVVKYPVLPTANATNTRDIPNRRVNLPDDDGSLSLDTIILLLLIPCQALFFIIYEILHRRRRDDLDLMIGLQRQPRRSWRHKWRRLCVNSVGSGICLGRRLLKRGTRTSRRLLISFLVPLLLLRKMTSVPLSS